MSEHYHSVESRAVLEALGVPETGLTEQEAKERLQKFGFNELRRARRSTPVEIFFRQFKSWLIVILIAASAISFVLGETTDAVIIASIVILNAVLGFVQEYRAEKAIEALKKTIGW